jgi:hypothetical protein
LVLNTGFFAPPLSRLVAAKGSLVRTARIVCCLAAGWWALAALPALAQRVQFASPLGTQPTPSTTATPPPTPSPQPSVYGQSSTVAPSLPPSSAAPSTTFGAPGATLGAPTTAPPSLLNNQAPVFSNPSGAAAVQPPPANWDPYATPGAAATTPLLPQDPYFQSVTPPVSFTAMQRFVQHIDADYHWFAGSGNNELGINDVDVSVTCALPMFFNSATPLQITPGFAFHFWQPPASVDLPPRTYDAYLDAGWNPQVTPWFGGELNFRIGVYSDFSDKVTTEAIRYKGKGLAVLTFSPSIKIKAGIWYLDRVVVKLLPAGGICWTPNPDIYFDILFPNPKIGKRLTTWGNTDWWIYVTGEYGGGTWQIKRQPPAPSDDLFDYNDIRVAVGLEFNTLKQLHGMFEVGGSFSREIVYRSNIPHAFYPNNTVYLHAGLAF